jgi:hypothetical protein
MGRKLGAGPDPELCVDPGEVGFDCLDADEEPTCNLLVLRPRGRKLGDTALGRRELSIE